MYYDIHKLSIIFFSLFVFSTYSHATAVAHNTTETSSPTIAAEGLSCSHSGLICTLIAVTNSQDALDKQLVSYTSNDGGYSWSAPHSITTPAAVEALFGDLICNKLTHQNCRVAASHFNSGSDSDAPFASFFASQDGGNSWASVSKQPLTTYTSRQICSDDAQTCIADSNHGLVISHDFGTTWNPISVPAHPSNASPYSSFYQSACNGSLKQCTFIEGYIGVSTSTVQLNVLSGNPMGTSNDWVQSTIALPNFLNDQPFINVDIEQGACDHDTGLQCLFTGSFRSGVLDSEQSFMISTTDGGKTWGPIVQLKKIQTSDGDNISPLALACDHQAKHCVAIAGTAGASENSASYSYITNDGGQTWSEPTLLPMPVEKYMAFDKLSCDSTGNHCMAIGSQSGMEDITPAPLLYYVSENGGVSWQGPMKIKSN